MWIILIPEESIIHNGPGCYRPSKLKQLNNLTDKALPVLVQTFPANNDALFLPANKKIQLSFAEN